MDKNKTRPHPILPVLEAAWARIKKPSRRTLWKLIPRDYEPEQAWGTAADFRKHRQYGGTQEDY
jgi:hypothetical protein